jgi:Fe-S-cluster containining protein
MNNSFKKLKLLYNKMDRGYTQAANHYGFLCSGCKDNCCRSFFFHHTFVEKNYLLNQAGKLNQKTKQELKEKAEYYLKKISHETDGIKEKPLCPLNIDDKCILYEQRPMICRLHGIPHHLNIPGRAFQENPGCDAGLSFFNTKDYFSFDRVPYYKEMAEIEKEYKQVLGKNKKIKQTIAHMLLDL